MTTEPLLESGHVELRPADLDSWSLRLHITLDRADGVDPTHFARIGESKTLCERYQGKDVTDFSSLTSNRSIFEEWYKVGWACPWCAEVLHS